MNGTSRITNLRYAMIGTGFIFTAGIFPLTKLWPSGWSWGIGHSHYLPMILAMYATLGISLLVAARDPLENRSLIWFTIWSSVAHAVVMAAQALSDHAESGHLLGDVPALLLVAAALALLLPRDGVVHGGRTS